MNLKEVMQAFVDGKVLICHKEFYKISNDRVCRWASNKWVDDSLRMLGFDMHFFVMVGAQISKTDPEADYKKTLEPKCGALGFCKDNIIVSIPSRLLRDGIEIKKQAKFNSALNTLIELKAHPLSVSPVDDEIQYCIQSLDNGVTFGSSDNIAYKYDNVSPFFNLQKDVERAMKDIGEGRLANMFKVLQGVYDE